MAYIPQISRSLGHRPFLFNLLNNKYQSRACDISNQSSMWLFNHAVMQRSCNFCSHKILYKRLHTSPLPTRSARPSLLINLLPSLHLVHNFCQPSFLIARRQSLLFLLASNSSLPPRFLPPHHAPCLSPSTAAGDQPLEELLKRPGSGYMQIATKRTRS